MTVDVSVFLEVLLYLALRARLDRDGRCVSC